ADAASDAYENWAKNTDIPNVNALGSVNSFTVLRTTGLLGSEADAPYQYVELLDVADMNKLGEDISTETMQQVAAEFGEFADNPQFMLTSPI
ncbi:MAG: REDY-like protein HapK, partial [Gammaproteobacteria bacterium]|nr:REDY-like protein HapK [Gammaproteobacteria bacterium]